MRLRSMIRGAQTHATERLKQKPTWAAATLLVTLRCDLRCAYCDFPHAAGPELTTAEWRRLMAGLRRRGTVRVGISGGEPLVRPDLGEIARAAQSVGFVTSLVTNGRALNERLDDVAPLDYVLCTIEGNAATHDRVRGEGCWAAVIAGVEALRRRGRNRVGLICPVHMDNAERVEEALRVAETYGIRIYFQPVQGRPGSVGERLAQAADPRRMSAAFERIAAWKREGRPVGNSGAYLALLRRGEQMRIESGCAAGRYFGTILPDGRMLPCCMVPFEGATPISNLDDPVADAEACRPAHCGGCTIAPYLETNWLVSLNVGVLVDTARWAFAN